MFPLAADDCGYRSASLRKSLTRTALPCERGTAPELLMSIVQVTPIIAIAPLLLIYLPQHLAVLTCAWIVAFFPVLANTTLGLNSVDHNLLALFQLYKANRWQVLWQLKLPSALPQMLAGLRIAGGLSLIGAVVAEDPLRCVVRGAAAMLEMDDMSGVPGLRE